MWSISPLQYKKHLDLNNRLCWAWSLILTTSNGVTWKKNHIIYFIYQLLTDKIFKKSNQYLPKTEVIRAPVHDAAICCRGVVRNSGSSTLKSIFDESSLIIVNVKLFLRMYSFQFRNFRKTMQMSNWKHVYHRLSLVSLILYALFMNGPDRLSFTKLSSV